MLLNICTRPKSVSRSNHFFFDGISNLNITEGRGFGSNFMVRYYFRPRFENDGLSIASYSSGGINDDEPFLILGALAGYKFINYKNFTISAELGFGGDVLSGKSNTKDAVIPLGRLSIGYYFERKEK